MNSTQRSSSAPPAAGTPASRQLPVLPGATLGVLGGGQLGAMFAAAARRMGYRVEAVVEQADCPAARHCDRIHVGLLDDPQRLVELGDRFAVVTYEFENVPVAAARALDRVTPVRPGPDVLHTTQDRAREKAFLVRHGLPCAPHGIVRSPDDLAAAVARTGFPAVLKTCASGYDGKGQRRVATLAEAEVAVAALGPGELVLEGWIPFVAEISVVAARGLDGATCTWEPSLNLHRHHILDVSSVPSGLPAATVTAAREMAVAVLEALDVVGVSCVEFFVAEDGSLLVNEIAPRPHNSGHLTIEGAATSQFEQQVRAVCGLPLGSTRGVAPAAMVNLLGDCWERGEPDWAAALAIPGVGLHLYGKSSPRPGRKMGHLTALAERVEEARANALEARRLLSRHGVG